MGLACSSILPSWGRWQREALTVGAFAQKTGPLRLAPLGTSHKRGRF